jgi:hypothetical protein
MSNHVHPTVEIFFEFLVCEYPIQQLFPNIKILYASLGQRHLHYMQPPPCCVSKILERYIKLADVAEIEHHGTFIQEVTCVLDFSVGVSRERI